MHRHPLPLLSLCVFSFVRSFVCSWIFTSAFLVLNGFFPYRRQVIKRTWRCVTRNDFWPWLISPKDIRQWNSKKWETLYWVYLTAPNGLLPHSTPTMFRSEDGVSYNDFWSWPGSLRTCIDDFVMKPLRCGISCRVHSTMSLVLNWFFVYIWNP